MAGGPGVLAYWLLLYGLTEWFGVWYIASATAAWVANWWLNFIIQKHWTFRSHSREQIWRERRQYWLMAVIFLVTTTPMLAVLVEWGGLNYLVAQVFIMVVSSVISYFWTRRIFAPQERPTV